MASTHLIWTGLLCCLCALLIQLFPNAAFALGADVGASWLVFGFGGFLILAAVLMNVAGGPPPHAKR